MKPIITFIRTNSYRSESRLIKESAVLCPHYECWYILWNRDKVKDYPPRSFNFSLRAPFGKPLFALYLPVWSIFCVISLWRINPEIIHACDLEAVIPAYFYSRLRRTKIVYDMWDALIGRLPLKNHLLRRIIIGLEKFFILRSDLFIVPDPDRLRQVSLPEKKLGRRFCIIYNSDAAPKRKQIIKFGNKKNITVVYVGVLSRRIRGLEHIIEVAQKFSSITFHIAGYGPDQEYFCKVFQQLNLKNLVFHGRISHEKAQELNKQADIMVSLLDPTYENYQYATSTKIFEAFAAEKPVITTVGTASGNLIEKTHWGEAIPYTSKALAQILEDILRGEKSFVLDPMKTVEYIWSGMARRLIQSYRMLLTTHHS